MQSFSIRFSVKIMNFLLCFFSFTSSLRSRLPSCHAHFSFQQKVGIRFRCHCPKQQTNDSIYHFYVNTYMIALDCIGTLNGLYFTMLLDLSPPLDVLNGVIFFAQISPPYDPKTAENGSQDPIFSTLFIFFSRST
jgi:hypothetical protein